MDRCGSDSGVSVILYNLIPRKWSLSFAIPRLVFILSCNRCALCQASPRPPQQSTAIPRSNSYMPFLYSSMASSFWPGNRNIQLDDTHTPFELVQLGRYVTNNVISYMVCSNLWLMIDKTYRQDHFVYRCRKNLSQEDRIVAHQSIISSPVTENGSSNILL